MLLEDNKDLALKFIEIFKYLQGVLKVKGKIWGRSSEKMMSNFLKKLPVNADSEWIYDYLLFHFSRRKNQTTSFGKNIIMPGWILGGKALRDYRDRSDKETYYYREVFQQEFGLRNPISSEIDRETILEWRERERQRFSSPDRQYIHCEELSLYEYNSQKCIRCLYRQICSINNNY